MSAAILVFPITPRRRGRKPKRNEFKAQLFSILADAVPVEPKPSDMAVMETMLDCYFRAMHIQLEKVKANLNG
jgi:hypothetical protein